MSRSETPPPRDEPLAADEIPEPDLTPNGHDRGLLRWMLSLTSEERLQVLQDHVDGLDALRRATIEEPGSSDDGEA